MNSRRLDKKDGTIVFRISQRQRAQMLKKIEKLPAVSTLSEYCRMCITQENINNVFLIQKELQGIQLQIKKIGVNLNQIAKSFNQGIYPNQKALERYLEETTRQLDTLNQQIDLLSDKD